MHKTCVPWTSASISSPRPTPSNSASIRAKNDTIRASRRKKPLQRPEPVDPCNPPLQSVTKLITLAPFSPLVSTSSSQAHPGYVCCANTRRAFIFQSKWCVEHFYKDYNPACERTYLVHVPRSFDCHIIWDPFPSMLATRRLWILPFAPKLQR